MSSLPTTAGIPVTRGEGSGAVVDALKRVEGGGQGPGMGNGCRSTDPVRKWLGSTVLPAVGVPGPQSLARGVQGRCDLLPVPALRSGSLDRQRLNLVGQHPQVDGRGQRRRRLLEFRHLCRQVHAHPHPSPGAAQPFKFRAGERLSHSQCPASRAAQEVPQVPARAGHLTRQGESLVGPTGPGQSAWYLKETLNFVRKILRTGQGSPQRRPCPKAKGSAPSRCHRPSRRP